ncbi:protein NEN1-like [Senna tora]|uniref:Protein NEN1-like n=1 Tax=Senna tora TaxID=362788 RepID=A0A834X5V0_9FABA|nr:protein NEN1-like [Senna tora]
MGLTTDDRSEIVFFDVETTIPTRSGQNYAILEFGAILVCPKKLTELHSYSTLVRPADPSLISPLSERCNGISRHAVASAPSFTEIADAVYDLLHGRIWAGHNILRFDCVRIRDAFAEINRPAPEPKGTIDSLVILTQRFGRRAGDMKMATLATYFGLGRQTHRSLDDVRMNFEVLKYCATVLFLESSLPEVFTADSCISPNATTQSRSNRKSSPDSSDMKMDSVSLSSPENQIKEENQSLLPRTTCSSKEAISNMANPDEVQPDPFDLRSLSDDLKRESKEIPMQESDKMSSSAAVSEVCSSSIVVFEPDEICIPSISASLVPFYRGSQRIELLHKGVPFLLSCTSVKARFGISPKFRDQAGRPRLSFVVEPSLNLCKVLDACESIAQRLLLDSGSSSDWRSVVMRKDGFFDQPTLRLHIPTAVREDMIIYATEIYQSESSGTVQRILSSKFDDAELSSLIIPGTFVDAFISLDPYDYHQNAGIKLVTKKLIIHNKQKED